MILKTLIDIGVGVCGEAPVDCEAIVLCNRGRLLKAVILMFLNGVRIREQWVTSCINYEKLGVNKWLLRIAVYLKTSNRKLERRYICVSYSFLLETDNVSFAMLSSA